MLVNSLRFGEFEVPDSKVIRMARPVLGFESLTTFCLIELEDLVPFYWFQSTQEPSVAFLVCNPSLLYPDYRIEVNSNEIAELNVSEVSTVETYVIITIPKDPNKMTVNLQGPIIVNTENNRAKQLVLVNSQYKVRHSLLSALDKLQTEKVQEGELVGV